ncbi:MAG: Peptide chain release factor 2, partial [Patescibacteria group bacterium]|nr:Peptide chain release factor 2 [Patescibacteria group bacterium]
EARLAHEAEAPDLWQDTERAKQVMQQLADARSRLEAWRSLRAELLEAEELLRLAMEEGGMKGFVQDVADQVTALEERYQRQEFELLLSGEYDHKNALVSIHAGAGGTDAQDWAEMLLRMYVRYAERRSWRVQLLDESRGGEAGIKSVTFRVEAPFAYGYLRGEAGTHRLVRQSPFNADGVRQTSFASVEVLPELDEKVAIEINADDLRIDTFMSGGKGGQSVNTTYSAVRIVHLPTGITVSCQNERSQTQNKMTAMTILRAKLFQKQEEERQKQQQSLRGVTQSADWGSQIRSYVLHPYKMVKDHRTEVETSQAEEVLDGALESFIEGELRWAAGRQM